MLKHITTITIFVMSAAAVAIAGDYAGTTSFDLLKLDTSVRNSAIGSAGVAMTGDVSMVYHNPASIASVMTKQAYVSYRDLIMDSNMNTVSVLFKEGWAISYNRFTSEKFRRVTYTQDSGNFDVSDTVTMLTYAQELSPGLRTGINIKYLYEQIDYLKTSGFGFDLGLIQSGLLDNRVSAGIVIQNIATGMKYQSRTERVPLIYKIGFNYCVSEKATCVFDMNFEQDKKSVTNFGVEFTPLDMIALRVGINNRNQSDTGLTYGLGFKVQTISFDYSVVPYGDFGVTQHLGVSMKFGNVTQPVIEPVKPVTTVPEVQQPVVQPVPEPVVQPSVQPVATSSDTIKQNLLPQTTSQ